MHIYCRYTGAYSHMPLLCHHRQISMHKVTLPPSMYMHVYCTCTTNLSYSIYCTWKAVWCCLHLQQWQEVDADELAQTVREGQMPSASDRPARDASCRQTSPEGTSQRWAGLGCKPDHYSAEKEGSSPTKPSFLTCDRWRQT